MQIDIEAEKGTIGIPDQKALQQSSTRRGCERRGVALQQKKGEGRGHQVFVEHGQKN